MNYNWEGDCIINECVVNGKRFVRGKVRKSIPTDIRDFVAPQDDVICKRILSSLAEEGKIPVTKKPGDFDKRAIAIWDFVARTVVYECDFKNRLKGDFWLFPAEISELRTGDCEDSSFLLASLLIGSGISPFNVRVVLGELLDRKNRSIGGHSWAMYKNEAGVWCILESTFDRGGWTLPPADRVERGPSRREPLSGTRDQYFGVSISGSDQGNALK